jgi:hypothetical protein
MKNLNLERIQSSFIDLSQFNTSYSDKTIFLSTPDLLQKLYDQTVSKNGYAVCFNTCKIMLRHGLDIKSDADAAIGRQFLGDIFKSMANKIDIKKYSPTGTLYDAVVHMDVDGFKVNKVHSPNMEHTPPREFVTTKCIHFDAATPFIANIYGPNKNITKGFPIICDTKNYCLDKNIDPADLVENIPDHYNIVVKKKFYREILDHYSFGLDINLDDDLVMIVLHNEIRGGVAHAATQPFARNEKEDTNRPIRHLEYQFNNIDDLSKWYESYHLTLLTAGNSSHHSPASGLDYYRDEPIQFNHFIKVSNAQ